MDAAWTLRRYDGRMNHFRNSGPAALLIAGLLLGSASAATPPPGGSNQAAGFSGPITSVLFNGNVRLRGMSLTHKNIDGDDMLVFTTIVSNGTHSDRVELLEAHLADADGITIDQTAGDPEGAPCTLPPGGACRMTFHFKPSADFHPVKILVEEWGHGRTPVFRISL